jgi:hypothetical protein
MYDQLPSGICTALKLVYVCRSLGHLTVHRQSWIHIIQEIIVGTPIWQRLIRYKLDESMGLR